MNRSAPWLSRLLPRPSVSRLHGDFVQGLGASRGIAGLAAALLLSGFWTGIAQAAGESPTPAKTPAAAQSGAISAGTLTYADLVDLADHAALVLQAKPRKATAVPPAQTGNVKPGWARLYVEARTTALLAGSPQAGEALRYLADVQRDARGGVPRLGKGEVIVFGRPVAGRSGELQLVAPDAQLPWDAAIADRIKAILGELYTPGAPPRIDGVREAIYVSGTLAGEGETQLFLGTGNRQPASITVVHRPGESTRWSVTFSEVLDSTGRPPARDTLTWYRLACFLPARLPAAAHVSAEPGDRARAEADYALVKADLGPCLRNRS